jgi:uncharacterized protein (TIGR03067 family)
MSPALFLLLLADTPPIPEVIKEPPKELTRTEPKMAGTWSVVAAVKEGDRLTPERMLAIVVTIDGSSITIRDPDSIETGAHTLDRSVRPKIIDILSEKAPKDRPVLGVYDLDGDTLKIAWARSGKPRPRSPEVSECFPDDLKVTTFLVLKRKKS